MLAQSKWPPLRLEGLRRAVNELAMSEGGPVQLFIFTTAQLINLIHRRNKAHVLECRMGKS